MSGPPPNYSYIEELERRETRSLSRSDSCASSSNFRSEIVTHLPVEQTRTYNSYYERNNSSSNNFVVPEKENRLHRSVSSIETHHHYHHYHTRDLEQEKRQIDDDAMLAKVLQEEEARLSINASRRAYSSSSSEVYGAHRLTSSLNSASSYRPIVIATPHPPPPPPPLIIERRLALPPPPPPPPPMVVIEEGSSSFLASGMFSETIPLITFDVAKRFLLTKKSWSMGGEFYIKDEAGEEIFRVKGKLLSVGARLKIVDLRGVELAYIYQRLAFRKPYYEVWKCNQLFMSLKGKKKGKELGADSYSDGSRFSFIGRYKDHDYEMRRGTGMLSHQVARVYPFNNNDSYVVEVAAKEDVIVMLSAAIIIERICQS